jgi:hypothetical protein
VKWAACLELPVQLTGDAAKYINITIAAAKDDFRYCQPLLPASCFLSPDSMESCGIDVYATIRANGFPIEVVKDRAGEQNYYGLVLIE